MSDDDDDDYDYDDGDGDSDVDDGDGDDDDDDDDYDEDDNDDNDGGQLHRLRLYSGDRVVRVTGRSGLGPGGGVDQITFHTKK